MTNPPTSRVVVNRWIIAGVLVGILGIAQFVFCTHRAMGLYAGGNVVDHSWPNYDWNRNWLSDLGRHVSWSKQNNDSSAMYFNSSVILLGISLGIFFGTIAMSVEELDVPTIVMQGTGFVSCLGLIAIGCTPVDIYYTEHLIGLAVWIVPIPIMATLFAIQCLRTAGAVGWVAGAIASVAAMILIAAIFAYAAAGSPTGYVVMQKIVVSIAILWFLLICLRVAMAAVETVTLTRREKMALQVDRYASRLEKGHRRKRD